MNVNHPDFAAFKARLPAAGGAGYETRSDPSADAANLGKLAGTIDEIAGAFSEFKRAQDERLDHLETRISRPGALMTHEKAKSSLGLSADSHKALDTVFRNWIAGDPTGLTKALGAFQETRSMRVGIDSDGGYFSPVESGLMVQRIAQFSPIVGQATQIPLRTGTALEGLLDLNQFAANWVGEESARPETASPDIGKYRIELREIYSMPSFTQTLIDQAEIDVVSWATERIFQAFAQAEELAMVAGDGITRWRGFSTMPTAATVDASRAWGTFQHVNTGANGAFHTTKADPLVDLVHAMDPRYLPNAKWFMPRTLLASIRKLKEATSDQYIWQPGLTEGEPTRLLGFPVVPVDSLPAVATGSLSAWFGDMSACYSVIRRPGIKLLTDPYTDKPKVRLYAYSRSGGAVVNTDALKALRFSA
jgi:HK97 family phage major capsid protein